MGVAVGRSLILHRRFPNLGSADGLEDAGSSCAERSRAIYSARIAETAWRSHLSVVIYIEVY